MRNLLILAKWLAGRVDVDVVEYTGSTACIGLVKGRRVIRIPSHWSYTNDPEASELLEGVIDHEALGHGRFTDLEGRAKAEDAGLIKFNSLSANIQNILEDVYIENRAIDTYPGVKANLARTVEILVGRGFFGTPAGFATAQAPRLMTAGLLNILRHKLVPGQEEALRVNAEALEVLLPIAMGQLWTDVLAIAMEVKNSKETADNINLTVRIMALLESASKEDPQKGEPEDEAKDDDTQDPQDQEATSPEPAGQGEGEGPTDPVEGGADGQPSDEPANGKPGKSNAKDAKFSEKEVQAAKDIIDAQDDDMPETEMGEAISALIEQVAKSGDFGEMAESTTKSTVTDAALRVCTQVKSISDDLQDALLAETRCEKSTKFVGKSLNNRVLSRVRLGNSRVFRQKTEGVGIATAVSVLVDVSGSMNAQLGDGIRRFDGAIGLIYGLGDILDEFDLPFEINAYSDKFTTTKAFGDEWTQIRKSKETPRVTGGTYTGIALQKALGNLVVRQEDRKLMIVITDGDTSDLDVLMSCYAEAREMGIEIASVMIGPLIPSIDALASRFGFKAVAIDTSAGLGRFTVDRVLESI
jgi:uncharacterized protein with von Willebrand factor type A (vWA) domain